MELIKNELEFYSKFARPLIFALPDATDRILASAWVKKIREETAGSEKIRTDYMKLLLFAMQRKKLVGIFTDDPSNYETLSEFPQGYDLNAMAKMLIEKEQKDRINNICNQISGIGDFPPYTTDFSADLREYVAAQDIPGFGVHCYYAISKNPITTWNKADKVIIPKGAKGIFTAAISQVGVKDQVEDGSKAGKSLTDITEEDDKKKRKKRRTSQGPLIKPLGVRPPKAPEGERKPPTWSSNLLNVKETTMRDLPLSRSTGAIPKQRIGQTQVQFKGDEEITEIERAIEDFQRGEIKVRKGKVAEGISMVETDGYEYDQMVDQSTDMDDDDIFLDLDQSQYDDDVNQDALLVKYIRDTVDSKSAEKDRNKTKAATFRSLPAQAGIPVTTPRPSVSPRRQLSTERLLNIISRSKVPEDELLETTLSSPDKDPDMSKLFLEATAIEDTSLPEDIDFDFEDESDSPMFGEQIGKEVREPMPRPTRGSPAGNAIVSEVIPALEKGAQNEITPFKTPPRFPLREQEELPLEQEMLYIDYVCRDRETAEMMKRIAHKVRDVEQDFPDPVNLVIPTLPFQDVGPMPFLEEETIEFPPSPEKLPSPPRQPIAPVAPPPAPCSPKTPPRKQTTRAVCGAKKPSPEQQLIDETQADLSRLQTPRSHKSPQRPTGQMFFPPIPSEYQQWPSPDENLTEAVRQHQINQRFLDRERPAMQKRIVVGKTAGRSKKLPRKYIPPQLSTVPIEEHVDERLYGHALQMTPDSPEPFADDDTMLEFARGYAPPTYESPPGIFFESPPQLDTVDYSREAPTGYGYRAWMETQKENTRRLISDLHRALERAELASARIENSLGRRAQPAVQRQSPRGLIRRRLDFGDIEADTDTFIANSLARHPDLPPLPPEERPIGVVVTPPRTGIPGWDSPERPLPTTPPFYHMPFTSQMLDTAEAPFEGVEFSPPRDADYEDFYAQHGPDRFVERIQPHIENIPADDEYFSMYSGSPSSTVRTDQDEYFGTQTEPIHPPPMLHQTEVSRDIKIHPGRVEFPPRSIQTPPRRVESPAREFDVRPGGFEFPARGIQFPRRGDEYFRRMAESAEEEGDLFGTDIDAMEFPPSPTGSPADRSRFQPAPMSPRMLERFQRLQETSVPMKTVTSSALPFETPPRRRRQLQHRIITPDAADYGLPPLTTYSPLSRVEMPCELPTTTRTLESYRKNLYDEPCCRYHQKLRENQ